MAIIWNYTRKLVRKSSKLYSCLRFLTNFKVVKLLLKWPNRLRHSRWKKNKKLEWKSFLKNSGSIPETINGTVKISINERESSNSSETKKEKGSLYHRHVWVNGQNYEGMEDNDIRGFLDGRFKFDWNQPGQVHVRVGRHPESHDHGEWELFRILQRWDNLGLPKEAKILKSRIELEVEVEADCNLEVLLYEVYKDWNPGKGGIDRNNISTADQGEVWWNEVAHNIKSWGLPGASFASDSHSEADTPKTPIAIAHYQTGDSMIVFESKRLASYIEEQIRNGKPLLFLLKLSDYLEDIPNTCFYLYSGNHGDNQNTARRPRLIIDWQISSAVTEYKREVLLEHNRSLLLPRFEVDNMDSLSVSFTNKYGDEQPTIRLRGGNGVKETDWHSICFPKKIEDWTWFEIRIDAHFNPIVIGQNFMAEFRDTWVRTAPPEEQKVPCTFLSPSNKKHTVLAQYIGDYSWQIKFKPDELGRWQYYWTKNFDKPYKSPQGIFDVVPGDRENILQELERLIKKIKASKLSVGEEKMHFFGPAFYRLQRELMKYEIQKSSDLNEKKNKNVRAREMLDKGRRALNG